MRVGRRRVAICSEAVKLVTIGGDDDGAGGGRTVNRGTLSANRWVKPVVADLYTAIYLCNYMSPAGRLPSVHPGDDLCLRPGK